MPHMGHRSSTSRTDVRLWWPVQTGAYVAVTEADLNTRDRSQALQFLSSIEQHVVSPGSFNDLELWREVWQYLMTAEYGCG